LTNNSGLGVYKHYKMNKYGLDYEMFIR